MKTINYFLKGTGIATIAEISKLKELKGLLDIDVSNTLVGDSAGARQEILIVLPFLQSLNNEKYTNEEKSAARDAIKAKSVEEQNKPTE